MRSVSVVAKFKTRQYVLKTDSPNLMLAKFSRYAVVYAANSFLFVESFSLNVVGGDGKQYHL